MKSVLLLTGCCFALSVCFAQRPTDYSTMRSELAPSLCGDMDSLLLAETRTKLEAFDTTGISRNLQVYYEDLGLVYYDLFLYTNDTSLMRKAIAVYDKALFHDPKSFSALWNSIFAYYILGDCPNVLSSITRFKSRVRKKYWEPEELEPMANACSGN